MRLKIPLRAPYLAPVALLLFLFVTNSRPGECQENEEKKNEGNPPALRPAPPAPDDEQVEPPFPRLTHESTLGERLVFKIVTETVAPASGGITTQEEYVDLRHGKAAYVQTHSQEVILSSAHLGQIFKYRPYTCEAFELGAKIPNCPLGWFPTGRYGYSTRAVAAKPLPITGLAGIWLWAEGQPKKYSRARVAYNIAKNLFKKPHVWTVDDTVNSQSYEFHFITNSNQPQGPEDEMSLESVRVLSLPSSSEKAEFTINVLALDFELQGRDYEDMLQIPLGYDCAKLLKSSNDQSNPPRTNGDTEDEMPPQKAHADNFWSSYFWANSRVSLEVTATKMEPLSDISVRSTDTMVVEIAHALIDGGSATAKSANDPPGDMLMTRVKSKLQETKTILNHLYLVKYHIDTQRGTCAVSHLPSSRFLDTSDETQDELQVQFANDLVLSLHKRRLQKMFSIPANGTGESLFIPVKMFRRFLRDDKALVYQLLERPSYLWTDFVLSKAARQVVKPPSMVAREMQTLVKTQTVTRSYSDDGGDTKDDSDWRIESHTIWLLDADTQSKILATYHLSVIEERGPLDTYPEEAKLFDVSEGCYLNDPQKKSGKDYAWLELFYPLASRQLDVLMDRQFKLKQVIYDSLMRMPMVTSFTMPRLELMFSDEGLIVRLLVLDLPPVDLLYDSRSDMALTTGVAREELMFTVPDVSHCSQLCQMYSCLTMTFCPETHVCLVTTRASQAFVTGGGPAGSGSDDDDDDEAASPRRNSGGKKTASLTVKLTPKKGCTSYGTTNEQFVAAIKNQRLSNVISLLQHQDYEDLRLPAAPDEVSLPRTETGVTDAEFKRILEQYIGDVATYLATRDHRIPALTISLMLDGHYIIALPTKFKLENDPLDELSLDYAASGQDEDGSGEASSPIFQDSLLYDPAQVVAFFHEGLTMSRFDVNLIAKGSAPGLRFIPGVSYDQCALACLDTKCGTFSYCTNSRSCAISSVATIKEASEARMIQSDVNCFISQRDFLQNYQKFAGVLRPAKSDTKYEVELPTANDCAIKCATEKEFTCLSFEFCAGPEENKFSCFVNDIRHPESIYVDPAEKPKKPKGKSRNSTKVLPASPTPTCDHYERSYLAEFTQIEGREIAHDEMAKLKTTEYFGKTTFDCADICLNQLGDCSAFQFCLSPSKGRKTNFLQSCTMIQSRPESESERKDIEALVDADKGGLAHPSKLLVQNANCHLFALKPNSMQAHLRDLAMGETMTTREREALARRVKTSSGISFTWFGFILFMLMLLSISALAGFAFSWARVNNAQFRDGLDRIRLLVGR